MTLRFKLDSLPDRVNLGIAFHHNTKQSTSRGDGGIKGDKTSTLSQATYLVAAMALAPAAGGWGDKNPNAHARMCVRAARI